MAVSQPPKHNLQGSDFSRPQETRTFEKGKVDLITLGGVTFGRISLQPGWKWSSHIKPIANTSSCQASHTQYVISGQVHVVMDDGTERDFRSGEVCMIPAGHDAWVVGNEPFIAIDVTGMEDYAKQTKAA